MTFTIRPAVSGNADDLPGFQVGDRVVSVAGQAGRVPVLVPVPGKAVPADDLSSNCRAAAVDAQALIVAIYELVGGEGGGERGGGGRGGGRPESKGL